MKHIYLGMVCATLCGVPQAGMAQTGHADTDVRQLYREGRTLFEQQAYAASVLPLSEFLRLRPTDGQGPEGSMERQEAEYMLLCAAYETGEEGMTERLDAYLERNPDTPHANRLKALAASVCYRREAYDEALARFESADLDRLGQDEAEEMHYRQATCYLKTGQLQEAALHYEALAATGRRHRSDCTYYLSYIRYTQGQYEASLQGFLSLRDDSRYAPLVPYYMAEDYLSLGQDDKAEAVAQDYLSAWPGHPDEAEMYRVLGTAEYRSGRYLEALKSFARYREGTPEPRRDALYMEAIACYHCGVYTPMPDLLGRVVETDDALTQNAYLHMGLAYLQLDEKGKARMAFERAAASDADRRVKEQAAYNHALCIHETAYSAFGESVSVFENFLNEFPQSAYTDQVSGCLVEVYLNTRSYEAALRSIDRIRQPNETIRRAKVRILFQLGTQAFANADMTQAMDYFDRACDYCTAQFGQEGEAESLARILYWRGETAYRLEQPGKARSDFNRYLEMARRRPALQREETYALAHYNLGYIFFRTGSYNSALDFFETCLKLDGSLQQMKSGRNEVTADACNRIGDCYMQARRFDEAKSYYARAEALGTSTGDYSCYQLALVAGLQKDYARKVELLARLSERYPQSAYAADALYEQGRAYVQTGDRRQAIASYGRLMQQHPDTPAARKAAAETGLLYYQNDETKRAIEAYKHVLQRYPGSEEARMALRDLKSIYVETDRVDEFAALAEEMPGAVRIEAGEQDSLTYAAAEKVFMRGEAEAAEASFRRYLQRFPDGAFAQDARYGLCRIASSRNDETALLEQADRLLEYPDGRYSEEALLMRGEVRFRRGEYAGAGEDYRTLLAKATTAENRQTARTGLMRCAALLADDAETVTAASALLTEPKLSPELQNEARYLRAKAYLNRGETGQAEPDLQQLAQDTRTAYGAEARYLLAQRLYDDGRYADAEAALLEFIDLGTPHAYWMARAFVLLSDVYVAMDKRLDARQYLLSLQQNYRTDDDIQPMIESRLEALK